MNKHIHRYLGPSNWPQWLLRLLPFSLLFDDAAKKHDDAYFLGGYEIDRNIADNNIGKNMYKVCKYNPFAYLFALLYFVLVSTFGIFFFNYINKNK